MTETVRYLCRFRGVWKGALGLSGWHRVFIQVPKDIPKEDREEFARLACYETHEHVQEFRCRIAGGMET